MKLFSICLALAATISLQAQGIQFAEGSWEDILATAKAEGKPIFMDAYTTWCGPCKMMSKNVFTEPSVGDFYNANFINAKIDMEAGEGPALAATYSVRAYPTLLFIDGDGELVHRAVGYHDAEQFVQLGKDAVNPDKSLSSLEARYAKGERDPEFLYNYATASLYAMSPGAEAAAIAYLETQDDWSLQKNLELAFEAANTADSKLFDYIIDNKEDFEALYGAENVAMKMQRMILNSLEGAEGEETLKKVEGLFAKAYPDEAPRLTANFRMNYYRMVGEMDKYAETAIAYYGQFGSDNAMELNNVAWGFFEYVDDVAMLEKAIAWAERSVELEDAYYNNDTLASLHYKAGNKKQARKAAQHAIELAKAAGEDYSATAALLDQIEKMR